MSGSLGLTCQAVQPKCQAAGSVTDCLKNKQTRNPTKWRVKRGRHINVQLWPLCPQCINTQVHMAAVGLLQKLDMLTHDCNASIPETKTAGLLRVAGHSGFHSEYQLSQCQLARCAQTKALSPWSHAGSILKGILSFLDPGFFRLTLWQSCLEAQGQHRACLSLQTRRRNLSLKEQAQNKRSGLGYVLWVLCLHIIFLMSP